MTFLRQHSIINSKVSFNYIKKQLYENYNAGVFKNIRII
jgi:hypothetical protein